MMMTTMMTPLYRGDGFEAAHELRGKLCGVGGEGGLGQQQRLVQARQVWVLTVNPPHLHQVAKETAAQGTGQGQDRHCSPAAPPSGRQGDRCTGHRSRSRSSLFTRRTSIRSPRRPLHRAQVKVKVVTVHPPHLHQVANDTSAQGTCRSQSRLCSHIALGA